MVSGPMDNRRDWIGNLLTSPSQPSGNLWRHSLLDQFLVKWFWNILVKVSSIFHGGSFGLPYVGLVWGVAESTSLSHSVPFHWSLVFSDFASRDVNNFHVGSNSALHTSSAALVFCWSTKMFFVLYSMLFRILVFCHETGGFLALILKLLNGYSGLNWLLQHSNTK